MPILAGKRNPIKLAAPASNNQAGYSLLEIVIVIAILGLAAAVSGPSISRMVEQQEVRRTVRTLQAELSQIRIKSFVDATEFDFEDVKGQLATHLPLGWEIEVSDTLAFRANGVCQAGFIVIIDNHRRSWRLNIRQGDCVISGLD